MKNNNVQAPIFVFISEAHSLRDLQYMHIFDFFMSVVLLSLTLK